MSRTGAIRSRIAHIGRISSVAGFRLRPSLSASHPDRAERDSDVSPGFRLLPSLSVEVRRRNCGRGRVSPGFRLRPSLSAADDDHAASLGVGVAGVQAPAFVERPR